MTQQTQKHFEGSLPCSQSTFQASMSKKDKNSSIKLSCGSLSQECLAGAFRAIQQDSVLHHPVLAVPLRVQPSLNQPADLALHIVHSANISEFYSGTTDPIDSLMGWLHGDRVSRPGLRQDN